MESNKNYVDENSLISSVSDTTSIAQAKTGATKRKRKCVTMPKKSRGKAAPHSEEALRATVAKRKAVNKVEEESEPELVETQPAKPKAKSTKNAELKTTGRTTTKGRPRKKDTVSEEVEVDEDDVPSPAFARSNFAQTKSVKTLPKPVTENKVKPGVKKPRKAPVHATEEVMSEPEGEDDVATQPPKKKVRTESRVRQEPSYRRRAGSVSDAERGDPMLRRKLGDVTRKYENMEVKYRNLKDVAVSEANANVEKLRKQCEAITEASNKLVTSLKKELALQAPLAQESRQLKKVVQTHETEAETLRAANNELSATLATAQNEIKTLQAKLAAARSASTVPESKVPSSAVKPAGLARAPVPVVSESAQIAQLKLDLYGDLTGLIIRGVKVEKEGDTYDCIQTGRNGTLHFKLYIDHEEAKSLSFEEVEFLYTPLLDANRDRDLIEIMPPYLSEDITFARENAAKFYARVVDTLTRKHEEVEEETG
ncbi:hypothetical protein H2198_009872 [Neophaeococcomyces mojaviensis]|uniref:Uncharacterized protein n=1 Tax=Neophaeococcomyces mojaviensis TaxID=3383035 RepID=A0ACC2ZT69_9EURO|nr:hypothetical protein H2198_009872 [Knufia sp. JES_112]